jgi:hypothetical protein
MQRELAATAVRPSDRACVRSGMIGWPAASTTPSLAGAALPLIWVRMTTRPVGCCQSHHRTSISFGVPPAFGTRYKRKH